MLEIRRCDYAIECKLYFVRTLKQHTTQFLQTDLIVQFLAPELMFSLTSF